MAKSTSVKLRKQPVETESTEVLTESQNNIQEYVFSKDIHETLKEVLRSQERSDVLVAAMLHRIYSEDLYKEKYPHGSGSFDSYLEEVLDGVVTYKKAMALINVYSFLQTIGVDPDVMVDIGYSKLERVAAQTRGVPTEDIVALVLRIKNENLSASQVKNLLGGPNQETESIGTENVEISPPEIIEMGKLTIAVEKTRFEDMMVYLKALQDLRGHDKLSYCVAEVVEEHRNLIGGASPSHLAQMIIGQGKANTRAVFDILRDHLKTLREGK